jgi:hypothetical protein
MIISQANHLSSLLSYGWLSLWVRTCVSVASTFIDWYPVNELEMKCGQWRPYIVEKCLMMSNIPIAYYNVYTIQMDHSEKRKYTKCLLLLLLLAYYYVHSHPPTQGLIYGADWKFWKTKRAKFVFTGRLRRSDDLTCTQPWKSNDQ